MVNARLHEKLSFAAFPINVIVDDQDVFAGFTMQRVEQSYPIHQLYNREDRGRYFPNADFRFLVRAAHNLAQAFSHLHYEGIVIGDVNESGIWYSTQGWVKFIDCDSFQADINGAHYPCLVKVPEYTPGELHGVDASKSVRTANHDNFALAVMVFRLLMLGQHPYTALYRGSGESPTQSSRVKNFQYAYHRKPVGADYGPPPHAPDITSLPDKIIEAFERAFGSDGPNGRPTAGEWATMLQNFDQDLVQCSNDPAHQHLSAISTCPWCAMERKQTKHFFGASRTYGASGYQQQSTVSQSSSPSQNKKAKTPKSSRSVSLPLSLKLFLKNYFSFYGRTSRSGFWWPYSSFFIVQFLLGYATLPGEVVLEGDPNFLRSIFLTLLLFPVITLSVRRLHDIGKTGWWTLIVPATLGLGLLLIFYWALRKGDLGTNKHDADVEEGLNYSHLKNRRWKLILRRLVVIPILLVFPIDTVELLILWTGSAIDYSNLAAEEAGGNATPVIVPTVICFFVLITQSVLFKLIVGWKNSSLKKLDFGMIVMSLLLFCVLFAIPDGWGYVENGSVIPVPPSEEFRYDVWTVAASVAGCLLPFSMWIKSYFK